MKNRACSLRRRSVFRWAVAGGSLAAAALNPAAASAGKGRRTALGPAEHWLATMSAVVATLIPRYPGFKGYARDILQKSASIMAQCLNEQEGILLRSLSDRLGTSARQRFSANFSDLPYIWKRHLLREAEISEEAAALQLVKRIGLHSLFTSEYVAFNKMRYAPIPGSFVGSAKLKRGQPAWLE